MLTVRAAVESKLTPAQIGRELRVSRGRGSQLAALRKLDSTILAAVWDSRITIAHGYQLSRLNPAPRKALFASLLAGLQLKDRAKRKDWNRDGFKRKVDAILKGATADEAATIKDANTREVERELNELLCAPVEIAHTSRGAGSLTIRYFSLDELEGVLEKIRRGAGHG